LVWAIAVIALGVASIWLGLSTLKEYREAFKADPRSALSWELLSAAIFHGDSSSVYGPKLILLGTVFVVLGTVYLIADLITIAL
jgi:hypothetical protein